MLMKTEIKRCDEKTAAVDIYLDFGDGEFVHLGGAKFEGNNQEHARLYCLLWEAIVANWVIRKDAAQFCKHERPQLLSLHEDENGIVVLREL